MTDATGKMFLELREVRDETASPGDAWHRGEVRASQRIDHVLLADARTAGVVELARMLRENDA